MKAPIVLASAVLAICLAFSAFAFFRYWEEKKRVKDYCIPLIDSPIDLSKKAHLEFKYSKKYGDEPYFATAFIDCDKAFPTEKISMSGTAKILDGNGNLLEIVDLKKDCTTLGFPTIRLNEKMFYPLLNLPTDAGDYTLQILLDEGVSGLPKEKLRIKACYMTSMPVLLEASIYKAFGAVSLLVAGIIVVILAGCFIWRKRRISLANLHAISNLD